MLTVNSIKIGVDCMTAEAKKEEHNNKVIELIKKGYDMSIPESVTCPKCNTELSKINIGDNIYCCDSCLVTWEAIGTVNNPVFICLFDPADEECPPINN